MSELRSLTISLLILFAAACQPSAVSLLQIDTAPGSAEPHLARGSSGEIVLSYLAPSGTGSALRYSVLSANQWRAPVTVAQGNNWFVNWADFPSVVPLHGNTWAAHWLVKTDSDSFGYDIMISKSLDGGHTWQAPYKPHTDGKSVEHGFVSLYPFNNGVGSLWLDGRDMANTAIKSPGTAFRSVVSNSQNNLVEAQVVDARVCDCCQTDIAIAASGPIAVYRDRSSEEIRDIFVTRLIDGRWGRGKAVAYDGWKITACPVNGPAIAAQKQLVAVAWFTATPTNRIQIAFSSDSGKTFSAAIDLQADQPMGRVDISLLESGDAMVSWLKRASPGRLVVRRVSTRGELGPVVGIAPMQILRNSGFPQMVADGNRLIFAWTDFSPADSPWYKRSSTDAVQGPSHIRTATLDL
ncbi:MAG: hypothetical protein GXP16_18515 [Gammaproteobacteria bacterium]|nr:hypothetical protein [Gammaproteobacteria bacterium]